MTPSLQMQKPVKKQPQKIVQIGAQRTQQKIIIFDSGVLISFSMNGLLDVFKKLKGVFNGKFLITGAIKREVVETPIKIKRFELEALKIDALIREGVLEFPSSVGIDDAEVEERGKEIMDYANGLFNARGKGVHLLDPGECSCLALSKMLTEKGVPNVVAVDERTTRMLFEDYKALQKFLEKKLHTELEVNKSTVKLFSGFRFIRSTELIYVAYKKGFLNFLGNSKNVLDALLYGMRFKGTSISNQDIDYLERMG